MNYRKEGVSEELLSPKQVTSWLYIAPSENLGFRKTQHTTALNILKCSGDYYPFRVITERVTAASRLYKTQIFMKDKFNVDNFRPALLSNNSGRAGKKAALVDGCQTARLNLF